MPHRSLLLLAASLVLFAQSAAGSTLLGIVDGNVNSVEDLLLFDAIDDVTGIQQLAVYPEGPLEGLSFPGGDPAAGDGQITGAIVYTGSGDPLYFTVKAGKQTALYLWMPSGENTWDTDDFTGSGFSGARIFGVTPPGEPIPEPTGALLFATGGLVAGVARRTRRQSV